MTSTALSTLTSKLATTLDMGDGAGLIETLRATVFKGPVTDAQLTALMVVSNQYGLNPWTREIYAFPDKNNGIVPVVGVDGWARIINSHAQFDGMEFEQTPEFCTCIIYRKDRAHATRITEYMIECARDVGPWKTHPYRMLRHKSMIQCARIAFGFVGIYDKDEAERIVESTVGIATMGHVERFPENALQDWIAEARAATNQAELTSVWKAGVVDINKSKDLEAYGVFKSVVMECGAALKNAPTDVKTKQFIPQSKIADEGNPF